MRGVQININDADDASHALGSNFVVIRALNAMEVARLEAADKRATAHLPAAQALNAFWERRRYWPVPYTTLTGKCGYRVPTDRSRKAFRVVDETAFWRSIETRNEAPEAGPVEDARGPEWPEDMR